MKVYVIPLNKLAEWVSESFNPILDGLGNYVVAVDADYSQHAFNDELLKCEITEYVPSIIKDLP
jgi:hypothetical protein